MAVWSEVGLRELSPTMRLDAEYHQPVFLENIRFLKNRCPFPVETFGHALLSISGGATPLGADYPEEGVPFLRVQNIMQGYLNLDDVVYISPEAHVTELKRSQLKPDDVLLTITGVSYGKAAFVPPTLGAANINQHSVRMHFKPYLRPEYVAMFLNCRFGKLQSDMKITGVTRPALDYGEINGFLIPVLPDEMQLEIVDLCEQSQRQRTRSRELYAEAETLLLDALGLDNLDATHAIAYERDFQEVARAGRFDAEYFQPKYYHLMAAIEGSRYEHHVLESFISPIRNGFDFRDFQEVGTPYIRVGDVRDGNIDTEGAAKIRIAPKDVKKDIRLQVGDVLFTRKGSFGNAAVVRDGQQQSIISSEIMLVRPLRDDVLSDYLSLFLNSPAGFLQVERHAHGAAFYSISQYDLGRLAVIIPPLDIQQSITDLVNQSRAALSDAQNLLEAAKQRAEELIEEGA